MFITNSREGVTKTLESQYITQENITQESPKRIDFQKPSSKDTSNKNFTNGTMDTSLCEKCPNCLVSYAGTWELVNLFVGAKTTISVMKT